MENALLTVRTPVLEIGYLASGPEDGPAVVLMHGFPYDPHAYDVVADRLSDAGYRAIVPFMRGYGPTRFRDPRALRSGEQAAFGADLLGLIDALALGPALLAGYDWGGRAACVVSALWPDRVRGLVTVTGYNIFGPPQLAPVDPEIEHLYWYQHYLSMHRGRQMLEQRRREFTRYLWRIWSPTWDFDEATFGASAASFENPDFVEVVLHSYRQRHGHVAGDPDLADLRARTEARPEIGVPTVVLHGDRDMQPPETSEDLGRFSGRCERRVIADAGHNLPQERPEAIVDAVLTLADWTGG